MSIHLTPAPKFERPMDEDDPRLGHFLGQAVTEPLSAKVILLGFPSDEGVRRNGGRPGAATAPNAIREQFYKLTPDPRCYDAHVDLLRHTFDAGDLVLTGMLEADQRLLGQTLAPLLAKETFLILLGGGHETSYGHFLGYAIAGLDVAMLNWDAHPDVRPLLDGKGHSGSPFRQALEHPYGRCVGYSVHGLQPAAVASAHMRYLQQAHANFTWAEHLDYTAIETAYRSVQPRTLVSFDLDAVDAAAAPGVSAPSSAGLSVAAWLHAARNAGRCAAVSSCDIVELNPSLDQDHRTARLAARTVWEILVGCTEREIGHAAA